MNTETLESLLSTMGIAVFARREDGVFGLIGRVPFWISQILPGVSLDPFDTDAMPFLGAFFEDAQGVWSGRGPVTLLSDPWTEVDERGLEHRFNATAVRADGRNLLLITEASTDIETQRTILQAARESRLAYDRKLAESRSTEQDLREYQDRLELEVMRRTSDLAKSNESLRLMATEAALAAERERRKLALGLHDHVGQLLAAAKIKASVLRGTIQNDQATRPLTELLDILDQTIHATRSLTFELSPPALYELGLEPTIAALLEQIQERHGLRCVLEDDGRDKPLGLDLRIVLFQAVRELIFNTIKHANARNVRVMTARDRGHIQLNVIDDGRGFDKDRVTLANAGPGGYGLFSLRQRLSPLGAELRISSRPGMGTSVRIIAPLDLGPESQPEPSP